MTLKLLAMLSRITWTAEIGAMPPLFEFTAYVSTMTNNRFNGNLLKILFLYKGHETNKIRKTDKSKEIILWLSHLTADLRHIDNKNLKKNLSRKCLKP